MVGCLVGWLIGCLFACLISSFGWFGLTVGFGGANFSANVSRHTESWSGSMVGPVCLLIIRRSATPLTSARVMVVGQSVSQSVSQAGMHACMHACSE